MKKVYLKCVYKKNLGDDLLVKCICDRYPNTKFYVMNYLDGKIIPKINNLYEKKISYITFRLFRKIAYKTNGFHLIEKNLINKCDFVVSIAGSIFMEKKDGTIDERITWFNRLPKDFYLIGSNIGPVYTNDYIELIKDKVLNKAKDICLRDKKSYNLVSDLTNVRCAPDVVFSYDVSKYLNKKETNKVIISVINIEDKKSQIVTPNEDKYNKLINELIDKFVSLNYEVELFSFCSSEKDDIAINNILSNNKNKDIVKTYYYDGNVDEALEELSSSKIIIGTRFHANVLGLMLNKVVIPIIYNDKTRELIQDINFKGKYIDIENIDSFNVNELTDKDLDYKLNIDKYKKDALKHFKELDKVLGRK